MNEDIIDFSEGQNSAKAGKPVNYLKVFFRRKWIFIVCAYIGLVGGICASFILPPLYVSSTMILVEEEKVINPLIQGLAVSSNVVERMRTIREQLLGWTSLVELVRKLSLDQYVHSQEEFENLVLKLRKNIDVELSQPSIIRISYRAPNPKEAQLVTKTITDILVDANMRSQTKETDVAITFIKDQLEVYKRKMKEAEISKMQDELDKLRVDSTDQHPLVKDLAQRVDLAKKELDTGEFEVPDAAKKMADSAYNALKQELDKITNPDTSGLSLDQNSNLASGAADPNTAIYKLMLMDKLDSVLARDMEVNKNIYNLLLQKLETAKITQRLEVSKEGTRYTVIDPPRLPFRAAKPNKPLVIMLGLFLGSISGAGLVFAREFTDNSFLDIEDAKHTLNLPVLAAISRITTEAEIHKDKLRFRTIAASIVILSLAAITGALLYWFLRK